ncbi:NYN domain-containing protein [Candidatus Falkowbacteria bacterium]|nr:NYN domain-containing protein [Candidatus Falkowbacteria bacterium]
MVTYKEQRVGVFIDVQNMYYSAKNLYNAKVNFGNILETAVGNRKLIRAIAYVVKTKTGEEKVFFEALEKLGLETREKELMIYDGAKKADWDVGICIDSIALAERLDVIVIVSGDGDFIPLVQYLKMNKGCRVESMAFRETTSTKLVETVDNFVDLSQDKRRYLISGRTKRTII